MKEDLIITFIENMFAMTTVYLTSFIYYASYYNKFPNILSYIGPDNSLDFFFSDLEMDVMCL